ncbi:unnamed protein product [Phaedon cochleariae]|uniref:NAD(+) ADP-ribosyltransferase n=1 Tax=Phaedon cochleariae TaxID=80249 RepID=A0A9N9WYV0_PHACE|nr:unnamed protein product [Phaedon cochleariae]
MEFVILGKPPKGKDEIKRIIVSMGGRVGTKIHSRVMAIISTMEEVERMNSRMQAAEYEQIHVVPEDFLEEPHSRLPAEPSASHKSKSRSIYTKSVPNKVTLKLKGGLAVDPDSGLEHSAHVYQSGGDKYSVVLGITDIQTKKNSYYKLQLLEADAGSRYWVFRSWGRIGTTIGV